MKRTLTMTTPDGLAISAQAWGQRNGAPIVFIHGFAQSHLSWMRQTASAALLDEFQLITYDFRGHGASDKPMQEPYYTEGARFADELSAVLDAAEVERSVLVGWSYGARIIGDYLLKYGSDRVAGLNFVAQAASGDPAHFGPARHTRSQSYHEDLSTQIEGTIGFLRACFKRQPSQHDLEIMLAFNAMVPREVKRWLRRPADYASAFEALTVPVLVSHGRDDEIILPAASEWLKGLLPTAAASFYDDIGHAPFYEDAARFNAELAAFSREALRR